MSKPTRITFVINFVAIFVLFAITTTAQNTRNYRVGCIAYYNLENLFDTENDTTINDEEFLPEGRNQWTESRYQDKLENMASVIAQLGSELIQGGPAVLGVSEIENRRVLEDLVATEELKDIGYQIVHYDSPDRRGVDVGLLYQPKYYTVLNSNSHRLTIESEDDFRSRDQLAVSGIFDGDTIHFIVNHWPSRWGGEKNSRHLRIAAAQLSRSIIDSIDNIYPDAKIILMGDLNDDPSDVSIKKYLKTSSKKDKIPKGYLYNPMEEMHKKGIGSLAYRDAWNLFDQLILSSSLVTGDHSSYQFHAAKVFNKQFLVQEEGRYKGYPFRTFGGGTYLGGYSDHFPVYIFLIREIKSN